MSMQTLEKDFDSWWEHTGREFARPDQVQDVAEFTRLLCRIAYCQGRIDECIIMEKAALQKLRRMG